MALVLKVTLPCVMTDEEGEFEGEEEVSLPAKYAVCHRCEGKGSHVNPNIDGNGISPEEFDEDPEFRENYFNGLYDVACEECKGTRVVLEVDDKACDPELLKKYMAKLQQEADWRRVR
jgi:hypothetical protein